MSHPFTITRGGLIKPDPPPQEFAKFDTKRIQIERIKAEFIATRDKAIRFERHKGADQKSR